MEICLGRIHANRDPDSREIFENRRALERIRARFDEVFAALPEDPVVRIDASGDVPAVFAQIRAAVEPLFAAG